MGGPSAWNPVITVATLEKFATSSGKRFSTPLLPPDWFREDRKKRNPRLFGRKQERYRSFNILTASQAVDKIVKEIDMEINEITFYTNSRVILGYIWKESRRFYVCVANRVQTLQKISNPKQWEYMDTAENPADLSMRCLKVWSLMRSNWLTEPSF